MTYDELHRYARELERSLAQQTQKISELEREIDAREAYSRQAAQMAEKDQSLALKEMESARLAANSHGKAAIRLEGERDALIEVVRMMVQAVHGLPMKVEYEASEQV